MDALDHFIRGLFISIAVGLVIMLVTYFFVV